MRKYVARLLVALMAVSGCSAPRTSQRSDSTALRVMSFNIHHAAGEDGVISTLRIANVINGLHPDLVALQEVDIGTARVSGADIAAEIGSLTHMNVRFGKAIDFQGGAYGQAILSRYPIGEATVHSLPGRPGSEHRIAVAVKVELPSGRAVRFVSTHLDHVHDESDRLAQAAQLNKSLAQDGIPTILAGDFNAKPESETIQIVEREFQNSAVQPDPTYPATQPTRKIDWIFTRPIGAFMARASFVPEIESASDHRPLVADLVLKD